jgi:nucleoside-diphosphate-sugar epimerase
MRVLLTGHKGYIGAVAGPLLRAAGFDVVGLDTDLFEGCDLVELVSEAADVRKDIRDLTRRILRGSMRSCIWRHCRMTRWEISMRT